MYWYAYAWGNATFVTVYQYMYMQMDIEHVYLKTEALQSNCPCDWITYTTYIVLVCFVHTTDLHVHMYVYL